MPALRTMATMKATNEMKFHPLSEIFPLVEGAEFDELVADIREHGCRQAVVLFKGKILDGRNRYHACKVVGIQPPFTTYTGNDPVAYVISLNLRRRHLDASRRAMVAAKLEQFEHGGNRKKADQDANLHLDREGAASLLNVSERTVASAAKVLDQGSPELVQAVERGDVSVSAAAQVASLTLTEQQKALADGGKAVKDKAKSLRKKKKKRTTNALIAAWSDADPEEKRAFVRSRWNDIVRIRAGLDTNGAAQAEPDQHWIEADRDDF